MYLSYTKMNLIFHYKRDTVHENAGGKNDGVFLESPVKN